MVGLILIQNVGMYGLCLTFLLSVLDKYWLIMHTIILGTLLFFVALTKDNIILFLWLKHSINVNEKNCPCGKNILFMWQEYFWIFLSCSQ
jgi:hypothetical protein